MSEARDILFFADSSQDTSELLRNVLNEYHQDSCGPLLASFLRQCCTALRIERDELPIHQSHALPNFRRLDSILEEDKHTARLPALQLTELVLVQLAHFINAYERSPSEAFPTDSRCVGLCFGQIAAAAVERSTSLHGLVPLAVAAVRLAFRGGILAAAMGEDIERVAGSWALSVSRDAGLEPAEGLTNLQQLLGIPIHKRAWLSSVASSCITLSGPPSCLDAIQQHLDSASINNKTPSLRRLQINAPYHAEHLYSKQQVQGLLEKPSRLDQNGVPADACQYFADVMYGIFTKPIEWNALLESCKQGSSSKLCRVRTFGPELQGSSLVSGLRKLGNGQSELDADFSHIEAQLAVSTSSPLAIVAMAGRFPSAQNPEEFWQLLCEGRDCVREVPEDRFNKAEHFDDPIYGCFLDRPGDFDARFFRMSPREATNTDPAQRLGMTTVQEALDMGGIVPERTTATDSAEIGTFWGTATDDYREQYVNHNIDPYYIPGTIRAFGPGRVNFFYNFDGPAVSYDTACSSSLVALNHACAAIWNEDCSTAIIVGSNILAAPHLYKGLDMGHFLSKTGGCKTFDVDADGYCRGEAVGTVIIKRLDAAQADNDNILGVIRAVATNHSSQASSITRPHGPTQEKLFTRILQQANLAPTDISYVEMHGTGTQAGDSAEMTSVANSFAPQRRNEDNPLWIGAVKSNVGHGEGASGVTSLIKALLMLREKKIPPHIGIKSGVRRKDPDLELKNVQIPFELTDWRSTGLRRAVIANFSAAAGNTAMILEEAPRRESFDADDRHTQPITLSAKSEDALALHVERLLEWTQQHPTASLANLSYSLSVRRLHYEKRFAFAASSLSDVSKQLQKQFNSRFVARKPSIGVRIVFTGYSNMWPSGMKALFETSDVFQSEINRLDRVVQKLGYAPILPHFQLDNVDSFSFVQRQLAYAIAQMAMFTLIRSWNIHPSALTGHSFGEYPALYASGILSAEDVLYIIGLRAVILQRDCKLNAHGMMAVHASADEIVRILGQAEISCINGPSHAVISGTMEELEAARHTLSAKSIRCQMVDTPLGFHSSQMDVLGDALVEAQKDITLNDPRVPLLSPTDGVAIAKADQISDDYLQRHTRHVVDFGHILNGVFAGKEPSHHVWLELGPHGICSGMIKSALGAQISAAPLMRRDEDVWATMAKAVSLLYASGHTVDFEQYHREHRHSLLDIPGYALIQQQYWLPGPDSASEPSVESRLEIERLDIDLEYKSVHRLVSRIEQDGFLMLAFETNLLNAELYEVMRGHSMNGSYLCPASLYTDIALTIGEHLRDRELDIQPVYRGAVADLDIYKPIIAPENPNDASLKLRIFAISDLHDKRTKIRFETRGADHGLQIHAQCIMHFEKRQDWVAEWARCEVAIYQEISALHTKLFSGLSQKLLSSLVYRLFDAVVIYGDKYRTIKEVLVDDSQLKAVATIELYQGPESTGYECCPYWNDGLVHLAGFLINGLRSTEKAIYIASGWKSLRLADPIDPQGRYKVYVELTDHGATVDANCTILLGDQIVGTCEAIRFQRLPRSILHRILPVPGKTSPIFTEKPINMASSNRDAADPIAETKDSTESDSSGPATPESEPEKPSIDRKETLRKVIADQLGLEMNEFGPRDNLADLGLESLATLEISEALYSALGVKVSPTLFMAVTSIEALEHEIFGAAAAVPRRLSVRLQESEASTSKNLFLFPDGSGSAGVYSHMPEIEGSMTVYALNSPYLKKGVVSDMMLTDLVQGWVAEVKAIQPEGPYSLGGYSSGGYYAYEACNQLTAEGRDVETLILIDSPPRHVYEALPEDVLDMIVESGTLSQDGSPPSWLLDHFRSTISAVSRYKPDPMTRPPLKTYLIWASDGIAAVRQLLAANDQPATRITDFFAGERSKSAHGWQGLIQGSDMRMAQAPGSHFNLILPPHTASLSRLIGAAMADQSGVFETVDNRVQ